MIATQYASIGTNQPIPVWQIPSVQDIPVGAEAYYDAGPKCYWVKNANGEWITVNETSYKRILREFGLSGKTGPGDTLSAIDRILVQTQREHDVAYAGPLAGHWAGPVECSGQRILVTSSPKIITPHAGDYSALQNLLSDLLRNDDHDQLSYFNAYVKFGYEALTEGSFRPGQALALAGPPNCGKSLCQKVLTLIFGGRNGKPYRYMSGKTQFNGDLFTAEHLMIEDEVPDTKIGSRRNLGASIKDCTVNDEQSMHAKNRQALMVRTFWRLSLSLNHEPENLMILPPIDDSLADKIMLLGASRPIKPMPTSTNAERKAFWASLVAAIPGYLDSVLHWQVPDEIRCERFGVKAFLNPELLEKLRETDPEIKLLRLADLVLFCERTNSLTPKDNPEKWIGAAEELKARLLDSRFEKEVKTLLGWPGATGTYLARLESAPEPRVHAHRTALSRLWIIDPPQSLNDAMTCSFPLE